MIHEPIATLPPETVETGDSHSHVSVAVFSYPETATVFSFRTLHNAFVAGLRRNSLSVLNEMPIGCLHEQVLVFTYTVSRKMQGPAQDSIKQTLTDLALMDRSSIAIFPVDGFWQTVHGPGREFAILNNDLFRVEYLMKTADAMKQFNDMARRGFPEFLKQLQAKFRKPQEPG